MSKQEAWRIHAVIIDRGLGAELYMQVDPHDIDRAVIDDEDGITAIANAADQLARDIRGKMAELDTPDA